MEVPRKPEKFTKLEGTDDSGRKYEVKVTALLALRCLKNSNIKKMWMASNVKIVQSFDDIVLCIHDEKDDISAYLIQLKHSCNSNRLSRGDFLNPKKKPDFLLKKYFNSYNVIKEKLENCREEEEEEVVYLRQAKKIEYILFTNRTAAEQSNYLQWCHQNYELLDTSLSRNTVYKFADGFLENAEDFFQNLRLFTSQVNTTNIDELIKDELKRIIEAKVDINHIASKFVSFISTWFEAEMKTVVQSKKKKKEKKKSFSLNETDVMGQLTFFILQSYIVNLNVTSTIHSKFEWWEKMMGDHTVVILEKDEFCVEYLESFPLYINHPELKSLCIKMFGSTTMTLRNAYIVLWLSRNVPLILESTSAVDFKNIKTGLQLSEHAYKIIIICSKKQELESTNFPNYLVSLNDFGREYMTQLLNCPVTLQGRAGYKLKEFLDDTTYSYIKIKDVINIICEQFNVGTICESLPDYYIPPQLSKVIFDLFHLMKIDANFLLNNIDEQCFQNLCDNYYFDEVNAHVYFFKDSVPEENYHNLKYIADDYFEWISTCGSKKRVTELQLIQPRSFNNFNLRRKFMKHLQEIDYLWMGPDQLFDTNVCVINAIPGMGKTELLKYVAINAPKQFWVLKINLTDHCDYYRNLNKCTKTSMEHLQYFNAKILESSSNSVLCKKIFAKFLNDKKVLVLLDGFDEVSVPYSNEATSIAKSLFNDGHHLWVTTRPISKTHLEEEFDTVSHTLRPLVVEDQRSMLKQYFEKLAKNYDHRQSIMSNFIEKLLLATSLNLSVQDNEFTCVPLQIKLMADFFVKDFATSLNQNVLVFKENFDLIDLYDHFLEEKYKLMIQKHGNTSILIKHLSQLLALKTVFCLQRFDDLGVDEELQFCYKDDKIKLVLMEREGIIVIHQKNDQFDWSFTHRTFAEFLAAKWLFENYYTNKNVSRRFMHNRFNYGFEFLFYILDQLLAKKFPTHLSIIGRDKNEILRKIETNKDELNKTDFGGRTILHLIAMYGLKQPINNSDLLVKDDMAEVINKLPHNIIDVTDPIFDYFAMDFAIQSKAFAVADKLCHKFPYLKVSTPPLIKFMSFLCNLLNYHCLFIYLARIYLLQNTGNTVTVQEYCNSEFHHIIKCSKEYANKNLLEAVRTMYSDDVSLTFAYGSKVDIDKLISQGLDINQPDSNGHIPLYYLAVHNRIDMASSLFKDSNIDINSTVVTAFYIAIWKGSYEFLSFLIKKGVNINCQNNDGYTPLQFAVMRRHQNIASMLLNGSNVNLQNNYGDTVLHTACTYAMEEILGTILSKVSNISAQNNDKYSALHCAVTFNFVNPFDSDGAELIQSKENIVKLLLKNGIDVNLQDQFGYTALHEVCRPHYLHNYKHVATNCELTSRCHIFYKTVALLILKQKNLNLNLKDEEGDTATPRWTKQ
ncbi:hypothetical protein FQA39_LY16354 [Lamprigera yunnana]|nr:hypothetical protein FQA39_LY16354 [Lamprigera yunnana]